MQLFPPRTAEGKSKALNYLMPHIRRMPDRVMRDEFAADAAQKLGIDSALVREELRQAARKRRDEVRPTGVDALNEAERVLLRAAASHRRAASASVYSRPCTTSPNPLRGLASPQY